MYTIYCDGYLLHSDVENYMLISANLAMEVNTAGSLTFTILADHPNFNKIEKLKSEITVEKNNTAIWKGRVVDDTLNFDTSHEFYCEGKMKALADSVIRPDTYSGNANAVFNALINAHNAQVSDSQKILAGDVWSAGTISKTYTDYNTTYTNILDLVSTYGGYLFLRYTSNGDYLDWVEDFTNLSSQNINLGENILTLSQEISAEDIYTRCIPLGAETDGVRLKVTSVKSVDYMDNEDLIDIYGIKCAPVSDTTWDDITDVDELVLKGQAYLDSHAGSVLTLSITALDLSYVDADIDSFDFCDYINVYSAVHNISGQYLLSKLEIDITNPANNKITLGQTVSGITDTAASTQASTNTAVRNIHTILSKAVVDSLTSDDFATQAQAEAGVSDITVMTPLKTKCAIDALGAGAFYYEPTATASTDDKGTFSGNIITGQIVDLLFNNGNTSASPTIRIGSVNYTIVGLPTTGKMSTSSYQAYKVKKTGESTLTFVQWPDYKTEYGVTGDWTYERYASGICKAWGQITGIALTSQGGFGSGGLYVHQGTFAIPSGLFNARPIAHANHPALSGVYGSCYGCATSATAGGIQIIKNNSTSTTVSETITAVGTWK